MFFSFDTVLKRAATAAGRLGASASLALALSACGAHLPMQPSADYELGGLSASWHGAAMPMASVSLNTERSESLRPPRAQRPPRPPRQERGARGDTGGPPAPTPSRAVDEAASAAPGAWDAPDRLSAGYIEAIYRLNETAVSSSEQPNVVDIYRHAQQAGVVYHTTRPMVGDLVFFHNTFDRNSDGRLNDWFTLVGLVEEVRDDGGMTFLAYVDGAVQRLHLHLERPGSEREGGRVLNSPLRANARPSDEHRLASELFAGFASLFGDREEIHVLDHWTPPPREQATRP